MNKQGALALAFAATLAVPLALAGPASASGGGGDGVERRGNCSGSTDWKLKAKQRDGRIEVEGEVDSNKAGQTWNWILRHNGSVSARGQRQTAGPSGSFSVERKIVNLSGVDTIVFWSKNVRSGEVCRGVVQI